ncbi:MAG TPA: sugar ABC transporter ATP-binding protein [Vicinamibacterales bacterium]|nr:sugar ABC transporter ATP-binding protein [Vicinamibacterales bacterium]
MLRMSGIRKTFPGVVALDNVSFDLRAGEVHVLVGENGAGKSTLMKILSGACRRDAGDIEIGGRPATIASPRDAQALGVATIYQELSLVPQLTVAENILLGHEPSRAGWIDRARLAEHATHSLAEAGVRLNPARRVDSLGIAEQQMVEIAKALFRRARVIAMDEPTSALTAREIDHLFSVIRRLTARGAGVIYISHRLTELPGIGQRVTVLRDGRNAGTLNLSTVSIAELVRLMAARDVRDHFPRRRVTLSSLPAHPAPPGFPACPAPPASPLLQIEHLSGDSGVDDVCLTVHRGEIVGVAGLLGAGRTELARLIVGADVPSSGRVTVKGREVTPRSPRDAIRAGIGFLPEDRKRHGLVMPHSVSRNVALPNLARWSTAGWVSARAERTAAERWVTELRIKTPSVAERVARLSGGTQQRIVLARWLAAECELLVMDEPTRGVDVAARVDIYELMNQVTEAGVGILMISSDLPEVLGMSDRIYVMRGGRIALELDARAATDELVLQAALGLTS